MGEVYLARRSDDAYNQRVAVKVLRRHHDGASLMERFRRERQILASLDHPNIARCIDGGQDAEGHPFLVMEYIEGRPIDVYCDAHRLSVAERLRLMLPICSAVQLAHQRLVVHRDIKPANVLVTAEGIPKLLDFGIAKILEPETFPLTIDTTRTGENPLTPPYASPEQLSGRPVGTASDVYALGVLLYLLLTGQKPREVRSLLPHRIQEMFQEPLMLASRRMDLVSEDLAALASARRTHPGALRRRLQGDLDMMTAKALHVEPERRYESAARMADDVRAHLAGEPILAGPDRLGYRVGKWFARHRWSAGLAVGLAFMVLLGTVLTAFQAKELARQRDQAIVQRDRAEKLADFMVRLFPRQGWGFELPRNLTVRQLLERSNAGIPPVLEDEPEVEALLLETVGGVYQNLGLYPQARRAFERVVTLRDGASKDELRAQALLHLGETMNSQGDVELSRQTLRQALDMARPLYRTSSPELVPFLIGAAAMEESAGNFHQALEWIQEAASRVEESDGGTSTRLIELWESQAALLRALGRTGDSLDLWQRIYDTGRADLSVLYNLTGARREHGDFAGALTMHHEALRWMDSKGIQGVRRLRLEITRALIDYDMENWQEASERLQTIKQSLQGQLEQDPHSPRLRHTGAVVSLYRGYVAAEQGDAERAAHHWQEAQRWLKGVGNTSTWVRHTHVEVLLALGEVDAARPFAVELLDQGWRYRRFEETCARHGIFPSPFSVSQDPSLELSE